MKNINLNISKYYIALLIAPFLIESCAVVPFSELQSARTVGEKNIEITGYYSTIQQVAEEPEGGEKNSEGVQDNFGIQGLYGVSDKFDIGIKYEHLMVNEDFGGDNYDIVGIIPKYSIVEDKLAFAIPVGTGFGEGIDNIWGVYPTILATLPIEKDIVEFTIAPKYLIFICDGCETNYVALNFGFSFSEDLNKWAIRPEFGMLYDSEDFSSGHNAHFSLGFSYNFLSDKAE